MNDVSAQNMDLSGELNVLGNSVMSDVSASNLELTNKLYINPSNLIMSNIASLGSNLYEALRYLNVKAETAATGQTTVEFSFNAKGDGGNVALSNNVVVPFNNLTGSGCFIKPNGYTDFDTSNYHYTTDNASTGIWNFGVKALVVNTSTTNNLALGIFKNDELMIQSEITQNTIDLNAIIDCSSGDIINVKCCQGTGYINMDISNSSFYGYRTTFSASTINEATSLRVNSLDLSSGNVTIDEGQLKVLKGHSQLVDVSCQHLDVIGTIKGYGTIPIGGIIMWNGSVAPDGWALCDGTNETPDLRGRFIIGRNLQVTIFDSVQKTGGSLKIDVANLPVHSHTGETNTVADHTHAGTTSESGSHAHNILLRVSEISGTTKGNPVAAEQDQNSTDGRTKDEGQHTHTFTTDEGGGHSHTFTTNNTGSGTDYIQPYYVLAYIMRIN